MHLGELFRADAKAQGSRIVIGGWEVRGAGVPQHARWYSLELTKDDVPWAYARGDPFRSVAALELLATLVCLIVFSPARDAPAGCVVTLTAGGDNRSNGFSLDRMASTKFPLYPILMEIAEQQRCRNLVLSVAWRPRDENEEADALTNQAFQAFDPAKRIDIAWKDLRFFVLPDLVGRALQHFEDMRETRRSERKRASGEPPKASVKPARACLRERDPW